MYLPIAPLPTGPYTLTLGVEKVLAAGLAPAAGAGLAVVLVALGGGQFLSKFFRLKKELQHATRRAERAETQLAELRASMARPVAEPGSSELQCFLPAEAQPTPAPRLLNPAEAFVADLLAGKVNPVGE